MKKYTVTKTDGSVVTVEAERHFTDDEGHLHLGSDTTTAASFARGQWSHFVVAPEPEVTVRCEVDTDKLHGLLRSAVHESITFIREH